MSTILEKSKTNKKAEPKEIKSAQSSERDHMIAEAAYYRAEKRGFENGQSDQDWHKAEKELDRGYRWE